ncbi:Peptidyl-prolyl isomerase cwc27 [Kappamyces sp. JEL0680]|nr:Peptidyl-prolyl isomerase cwc27 [Kappamyces sp. JEL0680]
MSSSYQAFPATKGKVILKTSGGDLEIELWPKECPKACRNFVQLCLEGYYDDTPIHRIIPRFIVQAGDPTGTGEGGESIYGEPFGNEFHSRLKFSTRGLLAMANTGVPNSNRSQFFFTLDAAPALNGKNTIFGKIVGNTIFNLLKLGELETDKEDKPIYDARILSSTVLSNPFDDIEPRTTPAEKAALKKQEEQKRLELERASKPKGQKNLSLLSFGMDAAAHEKESQDLPKTKIKSSHDALYGTAGLSKEVAVDVSQLPAKPAPDSKKRKVAETERNDSDEERRFEEKMREKARPNSTPARLTRYRALEDQIKRLQGEIKQIGAPKAAAKAEVKVEKGSVARMRKEYLSSGRAIQALRKDAKGDVEAKLKGFERELKQASASKSKTEPPHKGKKNQDEEAWECSLHFIKNCSSCRANFGQEESDDDDGWMNASLKFEKAVGANVFEPKIDDYTVLDPRSQMGAKPGDIFGRDLQLKGDIEGRKRRNWTEKSTRTVKRVDDQAAEGPQW